MNPRAPVDPIPLAELDMIPRYAPDHVLIAAGRGWAEYPVTRATYHPPGAHPPTSPIVSTWGALELQTAAGSRWYGCLRAYINSELRMVIIGTPARDEVRMRWETVPEDRL